VHRGDQLFVDHAHHADHPWLWVLLLLLFVALAVIAALALVRFLRTPRTPTVAAAASPDAAIESVRLRYARGEIDRDEFVRVSTDLGAPPPAPAT
jgi:uncharacterized membrane protein